ncbi:5012_t:CDS:2 [Funneliformis geosporum]|nr:5012_t:CDS:2 [Funneliformis geosporum]
MYDILKTTSKTVEYLYDPNSRAEAMRIRYELLQQGKHVVFILTSYSMVQALAEKIFKLQRPDNSPDFSDINTAWDKLDYVAYTSTVEAGISFEKTDHFDAIISITNIITPKDTHYKANENIEKSVAKDLYKSYLANYWKAIRELFQILSFTGIDDKYILSSNMILEAFTQLCERFIEIQNQSLLFFSFRSHAKERPDLKLAIKVINAISDNWYGYTVKSNQKKIGSKE